jgi:signal transduction histidine kinase/streptogramin lyase
MKNAISLLIFVILRVSPTLGQVNYNIQKISVEEGLSHNEVYALTQDHYGYLWVGTATGLHRFSGNSFKTFTNDPENDASVGPGFIREIFEDGDGAIWVGLEGGGLSKYHKGKFVTYRAGPEQGKLNNNFIEKMIKMPDGSIYIATWGGGINVYKDGTFTHMVHDPDDLNSLPSNDITDLYYDNETQTLWVGTWGGGLCSIKNNVFTQYINEPEGFNSDKARTITKTTDGTLWIGSWHNGLFSLRNGKFTNYDFNDLPIKTAEENKVLCLAPDKNGGLWIGTFGGGLKYFDGKKFTVFIHTPDDLNSIPSNFIETLYLDNDDNLWMGSFGGGLTKLNKSHFTSYKHTYAGNSISDDYVRQIIDMENGHLLIGNRGKGIDLFDGSKFTPMSKVYGDEFESLSMFTMEKVSNGDIWMGGPTGVGLFIFSNGKLTEVSKKYGIDFKEYNINGICETSDGSIWVGGNFDTGLIRIMGDSVLRYFHDPENTNSLGANNIWTLYEGSDSTLWIGTRRFGLNSFKNGQWKRYRSIPNDPSTLSNDFIFSIHETSDGLLWLGTEKGLNKFEPQSGKFKRFFVTDGLINDYIGSILEDDGGFLWLGTHKGLIKINPSTEQIWNFDNRDGIEAYPFNINAALRNKATGKLYFGGVDGFVEFHPDSISISSQMSTLQITDLLIANQPVLISDEGPLTRPIEEVSSLRIPKTKDKITFRFSSMSYDLGNKSRYSYYLEGLENDWINNGSNQEVSYTNLPAGHFTLRIRSSLDQNSWSVPKTMEIEIIPFWWETSHFRLLLVLMILLLAYLTYKWRTRYLSAQRKHLARLVSEKTNELDLRNAEILNQNEALKNTVKQLKETQDQLIDSEKMASLGVLSAGIGHEINNPLNFIKGGVESLKMLLERNVDLQEYKSSSQPLFGAIQEGINRTTSIVKSLSHFSRNVDGNKEACDLSLILDHCLTMISNETKGLIKINKDFPEKTQVIAGNDGKLHQAFLNILINAVQAIETKGQIDIGISQKSEYMEVTIKDNGKGISKEHLRRIRDPFFTTKEAGSGTGIGLSITYSIIEQHGGEINCTSQVGEGTEFLIRLPVHQV